MFRLSRLWLALLSYGYIANMVGNYRPLLTRIQLEKFMFWNSDAIRFVYGLFYSLLPTTPSLRTVTISVGDLFFNQSFL